jgi:lysozyme
MNITEEGLALIRRAEGFRSSAYKDAAGVWTIGYGHTSNAGPPNVRRSMKITRLQAEQVLASDVASFALGVEQLLTVPLTEGQFSALVSFAYNVGLENFRKSSVLRAVNAEDFAAVPRRLSLWVKSRGRVLPGLVARRAAEASMFIQAAAGSQPDEGAAECDQIEPLSGKPLRRSSTGIAALVSAIAGVVSSISSSLGELTHRVNGPLLAALAALIVVAAALWIIRERRLKALEEGI